jgi:hypothetical protein
MTRISCMHLLALVNYIHPVHLLNPRPCRASSNNNNGKMMMIINCCCTEETSNMIWSQGWIGSIHLPINLIYLPIVTHMRRPDLCVTVTQQTTYLLPWKVF